MTEYLNHVSQLDESEASSRPLTEAGTLVRFDADSNDGEYTHGLVLGVEEEAIVMVLAKSRSKLISEGDQLFDLSMEDFKALEPRYDGYINVPMRVVSVEGQAGPSKLPYDPEDPGSYLYRELPIEQAPPGAVPVDDSEVAKFRQQQQQPGPPTETPVLQELRSDLEDADRMSKALAIHVDQAEQLIGTVQDFSTLINAAVDWQMRDRPEAAEKHRGPYGEVLEEPKRRDTAAMLQAKAIIDKIRSGLETSNLFIIQYRSVVYQLKIESDLIKIPMVHRTDPKVVSFRDYIQTFDEFKNDYFIRLHEQKRILKDANKACDQAFRRYRDKHSLWVKRFLIRYAQESEDVGFDPLKWMEEVKEDFNDYLVEIETLSEGYDEMRIHYEDISTARYSFEAESGAEIIEDMSQMKAAASFKQFQDVFFFDSYDELGNLKDATPLLVKRGIVFKKHEDSYDIIYSDGFIKNVKNARMVVAQTRKKKNKPEVVAPENITPVETDPKEVGAVSPSPQVKEKKTQEPIGEPIGEPTEKPKVYDAAGVPAYPVPPKQIAKEPVPPPPTPPPPPVPAPAELEPVIPDDIPREAWEGLTQQERIRMAASFHHLAAITYTKVTPPEDGVTKTYIVEIYSYRVKRPERTGGSPVWYLFAFDVNDGHIKAYITRNIQSVEILDQTFVPRWEVEFDINPRWKIPQQPAPQTTTQPQEVKVVTDPFAM